MRSLTKLGVLEVRTVSTGGLERLGQLGTEHRDWAYFQTIFLFYNDLSQLSSSVTRTPTLFGRMLDLSLLYAMPHELKNVLRVGSKTTIIKKEILFMSLVGGGSQSES